MRHAAVPPGIGLSLVRALETRISHVARGGEYVPLWHGEEYYF